MKKLLVIFIAFITMPAFAEYNIIVPFAVAGFIDSVARQYQNWVITNTKEPVVVENVGGGGGYIGLRKLDNAVPNTAVITSTSFYIHSIQKDFPLETYKYAAVLGESPMFLVTRKSSGLTCSKLKSNSRNYFLGTGGKNSMTSIAAQLLIKEHDHIIEVPYKGGGQAMIDVLSGQLDGTFISNLERSDDLTYLAVTSNKRFRNIPTLKECMGVKQTLVMQYILLANSSSSDEFVKKLNQSSIDFANDPVTIKWAEQQGIHLKKMSVVETNHYIASHREAWKSLIEKE